MSGPKWLDLLGWGEAEIQDMRFAGFSYIKQGQYEVALKFFKTLVFLNKTDAYDLQTLGALYLQTGNALSALDYLERSLKLHPNHEPTLLNRAKAFLLLGYKKQGLSQLASLEKSSNISIADQARALTLAYS